ncbi:hypothetical protein CRENBAI_009835 [Crenichthys baileyi]|uniref:Uncharacterized protein n=1 Tax=Crenichthys baileyi TaxID=28760 RepID=A0AAV9R297_9TELE
MRIIGMGESQTPPHPWSYQSPPIMIMMKTHSTLFSKCVKEPCEIHRPSLLRPSFVLFMMTKGEFRGRVLGGKIWLHSLLCKCYNGLWYKQILTSVNSGQYQHPNDSR